MKTVVEFKIIKDIDHRGDVVYYVHANKELIGIRDSLRYAVRSIKSYVKGIEQKQKEGLPKIIYTDTYSHD